MSDLTHAKLVEKVARAICSMDGFDPDEPCVDEKNNSEPLWLAGCYDASARAAISTIAEALKEPTRRMIERNGGDRVNLERADDPSYSPADVWEGMLKDSPLYEEGK